MAIGNLHFNTGYSYSRHSCISLMSKCTGDLALLGHDVVETLVKTLYTNVQMEDAFFMLPLSFNETFVFCFKYFTYYTSLCLHVIHLQMIVGEGIIMSTPLGGGYIIFAFFAVRCPMSVVRCPASGVRCPASRMVSAHLKEKY